MTNVLYDKEYYRSHTEFQARSDCDSIPSFKWIKDNLSINKGNVVLDAGCGTGHLLNYCCDKLAKGYGTDISNDAIAIARSKYPHLDFSRQDIRKLSFPDEFFDRIICFNVIEHIDGQDRAMIELKRVLKKDGIIIMGTLDRDSLSWRLFSIFYGDKTHVKEFNFSEFGDFISEYFTVVATKRSSCIARFHPIVNSILRSFLKGDVLVKAVK